MGFGEWFQKSKLELDLIEVPRDQRETNCPQERSPSLEYRRLGIVPLAGEVFRDAHDVIRTSIKSNSSFDFWNHSPKSPFNRTRFFSNKRIASHTLTGRDISRSLD